MFPDANLFLTVRQPCVIDPSTASTSTTPYAQSVFHYRHAEGRQFDPGWVYLPVSSAVLLALHELQLSEAIHVTPQCTQKVPIGIELTDLRLWAIWLSPTIGTALAEDHIV